MSCVTSRSTRIAGILYAIAAFASWGFLPLYWHSLDVVPAAEILAHRILWSFAFTFLLMIICGSWKKVREVFSNKLSLIGVILSSILISMNWFTYIWAINNNHIIESSLGYYINPLFSVLLGVIVLRERLNSWQLTSLSMAFVGVSIITFQYGKIPWVALSLTLTFGLYGLVKKVISLDSLTGLFFETLLVSPLALYYIIGKQGYGNGFFGITSTGIISLLIFSGVVTSLPLLWFSKAAKMIPLSTIGFTQYLAPSITLILGIIVFREPFTIADIISFGFIWCALIIYSISQTAIKDIKGSGAKGV